MKRLPGGSGSPVSGNDYQEVLVVVPEVRSDYKEDLVVVQKTIARRFCSCFSEYDYQEVLVVVSEYRSDYQEVLVVVLQKTITLRSWQPFFRK